MPRGPKEGSFRIGDMRRPEVRGQRRAPAPAPEAASVGFPAVEAWLEQPSADAVIEAIKPRYEALEAMSTSGAMREKGAAKKAMAAYERAADLFEYLFETKASLQSGG